MSQPRSRSFSLALAVYAAVAAVALACAPAQTSPSGDKKSDNPEADSTGERDWAMPQGPIATAPPVVPWGTVSKDGGNVQRLYFALTGDTRPGGCDETGKYPTETIHRILQSMKSLHVQFGLDLGDHMFVCNGTRDDAEIQMGHYMDAVAQGPATFWMTLGNHECGHVYRRGPCFLGDPDVNYTTYMKALGRKYPYYATDVQTSMGLARFVFVADDAWTEHQRDWLEAVLADADVNAKYTIVARHHPIEGNREGPKSIVWTILKHKYSLLLTAHEHTYFHDPDALGGRSVIVGVGGGPSGKPPGFGTVLQNKDGTLTFTMRDIDGNPAGDQWTVPPQ
ncbi:MAG: metallophosphoesterase [Deltaproteobacteria bacterium]|nr:metallophosphoesterase [Deltaproteobacteria bacterium]